MTVVSWESLDSAVVPVDILVSSGIRTIKVNRWWLMDVVGSKPATSPFCGHVRYEKGCVEEHGIGLDGVNHSGDIWALRIPMNCSNPKCGVCVGRHCEGVRRRAGHKFAWAEKMGLGVGFQFVFMIPFDWLVLSKRDLLKRLEPVKRSLGIVGDCRLWHPLAFCGHKGMSHEEFLATGHFHPHIHYGVLLERWARDSLRECRRCEKEHRGLCKCTGYGDTWKSCDGYYSLCRKIHSECGLVIKVTSDKGRRRDMGRTVAYEFNHAGVVDGSRKSVIAWEGVLNGHSKPNRSGALKIPPYVKPVLTCPQGHVLGKIRYWGCDEDVKAWLRSPVRLGDRKGGWFKRCEAGRDVWSVDGG